MSNSWPNHRFSVLRRFAAGRSLKLNVEAAVCQGADISWQSPSIRLGAVVRIRGS